LYGPLVLRAAGGDETLPFSDYASRSLLIPGGAVGRAHASPEVGNGRLYIWRNSVTSEIATSYYYTSDVSQGYAAYAAGGSMQSGPASLYRRDLSTGTTVQLDHQVFVTRPPDTCGKPNYGPRYASSFSVADNGDVAYVSVAADVYRYRGGTTTLVSAAGGGEVKTDGVNVMFTRIAASGSLELVLWEGSVETVLGTIAYPLPGFELANGWAVFGLSSQTGGVEIWRRDPSGTLTLISARGGAKVEAIGSDGTVAFVSAGRRYVASPSGTVTEIGSAQGNVLVRGDGVFVALGQKLMRAVP
jgi:hypothetical protein